MALDEATAALMATYRASGRKPLSESTVEEARALSALSRQLYGPGPEMARVDNLTIDSERFGGAPGSCALRVLVPHGDLRGVFVYYHGGGWVLGDLDGYDALGRTLAEATSCAVVLVDYRMAPEYRYPTAVKDAWAAASWAAANMTDIAGRDVPLIIGGDSAGGNLAAVVAQRARDEGGLDLALQVLIYPVTAPDLDNASYLDPENALMLTRASMIWFWDHYLPDVEQRRNVDASPLLAQDLSGLPRAIVLTAEHDVLRDEGEAYADRLRDAGVEVDFKRFPGQMHGFFAMVNILPGSAAAIEHVAEAIDKALASAGLSPS